jgi:hypothetical protein
MISPRFCWISHDRIVHIEVHRPLSQEKKGACYLAAMSMRALILALGLILSLGTVGQFAVWAGHAEAATDLATAHDQVQQRASVYGPMGKVLQSTVTGCKDFLHGGACSLETGVSLAMVALRIQTSRQQLADVYYRPLRPSLIDGPFRPPISIS